MLLATTTPPRLATLILVCALTVVSLNMFLPSLSNIAAEFGAYYDLVNLSIAGYAATTAVLQVVSRSNRGAAGGRRRRTGCRGCRCRSRPGSAAGTAGHRSGYPTAPGTGTLVHG